MAAVPTVRVANHVLGDVRIYVNDVTLDASYPTGGYPLTAQQLGLTQVQWSLADVKLQGASGNVTACWYDAANSLLKCYTSTGEVANATSLAGEVVQLVTYGY